MCALRRVRSLSLFHGIRRIHPSGNRRTTPSVLFASLALAAFTAGCTPPPPPPPAQPADAVAVQPAADTGTSVRLDSGVAYGDCAEALRRAAAKPDLDVDSLALPVATVPPAIDSRKMPKGVLGKNGYSEVHVTVVVDTLGKADMSTFKVVMTTHPWLAQSVKTAIAKWSFHPAKLAGCKVPRIFKGNWMSGKPPGGDPAGYNPAGLGH